MKELRKVALLLLFAFACRVLTAEDSVERRWNRRLLESSKLLKQAEYKPALKIATGLTTEMIEVLGPGNAATRAFGLVLTHKALALTGLGRYDDALWDWHTVLSLYPQFGESDLSSFGAPGAFLKEHLLPEKPKGPRVAGSDFTEPRVIKKVQPDFPAGGRDFGASGDLVVEVIITKRGTITSPRVLIPLSAPTLSYTALEAIRRWRYEPASVAGKPIEVPLTVTVHYEQR
jgi:TonB family protein